MFKKHACWILILSVLFMLSKAFGQDVTNSNPAIDPKADEVLQRMGKCLAGAKGGPLWSG